MTPFQKNVQKHTARAPPSIDSRYDMEASYFTGSLPAVNPFTAKIQPKIRR